MAKKLNIPSILNELKGESSFFKPPTPLKENKKEKVVKKANKPSSRQSSRQLEKISKASQSTTRDIDESPILDRPKAFYITKRQNELLTSLVKSMRKKASGKTTVKIDRSTIIRLLLDKANLEEESTADELIDTLLEQLSDYFER